jgi:hypothetical protein
MADSKALLPYDTQVLLYRLDSPSAWVTHYLSSSPSIQIPIALKVGSAGTKNSMRKYVIDMLEDSCRLGVDHYTISSLVQGCLDPPVFVYLMGLCSLLQ